MLKQTASLALLLASVSFVAAAQNPAPPAEGSSHVIMMVNLIANIEKTIDSKKAKAGDPVAAKTVAATKLSDGTDVPSGSILTGHIDNVTPSENKGDSTLTVTFDKLQIKNGKEIPVKATVVSVASTAPADDGKAYDPSSYRPGMLGDNKANGQNNQPQSTGPHPVEGLSVAGSPKEPTSGTFTQEKKNLHMTSSTQLVVSVAAAP